MTKQSSHLYRLDANGEPEPVEDVLEWGRWFESADRTVAFDELDGGIQVSTVFLGIDHSYGHRLAILWETMVFSGGDAWEGHQKRYSTRADALAGHVEIVNEIQRGPRPPREE